MTVTQELLKELFEYKDGNLYWKINAANNVKIGDKAGTIDSKGYVRTTYLKKRHGNHRLIYMINYGEMPEFIDHVDGNKLNNRIENLRKATLSQNQHNKKKQKNNKSGYKNVSWNKDESKWAVFITVNKIRKYFGAYKDIDYAIFIADAMRNKYHGKFANNT